MIQIFLKAREHFADFPRFAEVGDGVVILKPEYGCELVLIQFLHAHVMGKDEIEKSLPLRTESGIEMRFGIYRLHKA